MIEARSFFAANLQRLEGGLSLNPTDNGNWFDPMRYKAGLPQRRQEGKLVGSKFGVTAYALAAYKQTADVQAWEIAALTLDMAVDIATHNYFMAPHFNVLALNRTTLSIVDAGWMSGPDVASSLLQGLIGCKIDGKVGPGTATAYAAWLAKLGEEETARRVAAARIAFYTKLATNQGPKDPDKVYLKGWTNRANSFLPGTPFWKAYA